MYIQCMLEVQETDRGIFCLHQNQIEELTTANSYFSERLKAEEDRRKELADKCQVHFCLTPQTLTYRVLFIHVIS